VVREHRELVARSVASPEPPVVVYQMGKVSSSTVTWALKNFGGMNVFQVHVLHPDNLDFVREQFRKRKKWYARLFSDTEVRGRIIFKGIIESGIKTRIITLAREPIGRNHSYYFQNLDAIWGTRHAHDNVPLERLVGEYLERFDHGRALRWFDREFNRVLSVDVYAHPFPHDKGHTRINTDRHDILVIRTDLDDAAKKKCIEEFLGVEGITLAPRNVASQKPYAATYRKFLDALELPDSYVNEMLDSKYTRHFFSPAHIASLRAKWLGGKAG